MCLIALAWRVHPRYRLAMIANRDEFHARPTAAAGRDPDAGDVYGGRDLAQGGGWLQVSTRGRLAAVTNVRDGRTPESGTRSRGWLVRDFVRGSEAAIPAAQALRTGAAAFGRYNLLLWDGRDLAFASNHPRAETAAVAPGIHAMSNGAFDAPWPKSALATRALQAWIEGHDRHPAGADPAPALETLFAALADTRSAPDDALPDTGVGLELERVLSPPFISGDRYGTRCSTVVLVDAERIVFAERRFGPNGAAAGAGTAVLERIAAA